MNLKQKIEEWDKMKKKVGKWPWGDENDDYDQAIQALKEAAEIMKVNSTFAEKDEFSPHREWLKKWGFE